MNDNTAKIPIPSEDSKPSPIADTGYIEEIYRKFKNDSGSYTSHGPHANYDNFHPPPPTSSSIKIDDNEEEDDSLSNQLAPAKRNFSRRSKKKSLNRNSRSDIDVLPIPTFEDDPEQYYFDPKFMKSLDTADSALSKSASDDNLSDGSMLSDEEDAKPTDGSGKGKKSAKEKNREHARNTRIRKKNYIESLKQQFKDIIEERERTDRERKVAFSRLQEQIIVRKKVLQETLNYRARGVLESSVWSTLLEEDVTFVLPVTPYRSFPPLEVFQGQRYVRGIPAVILDSCSFAVMLQTIVPPVNMDKKMKLFFTCNYNVAVFEGDAIMCSFEMKTINGLEVGCRCDISVTGMLKAVFSHYNKIIYLELMFDVMMLMQQLRKASGRPDFSVVPNTPFLAQEQAYEGRIITESMPPYRIVYVSEGWQKLFGYRREQIIGKTCKLLQGEKTERDKVAELMGYVRAFLPCNTIITNYHQSGETFPNWIRIFPLYTDRVVSHFLGIMENLHEAKLPPPLRTSNRNQLFTNPELIPTASTPVEVNGSIIKTTRPAQGVSSISQAFRQQQMEKQRKVTIEESGANPSSLTRRLMGSLSRLAPDQNGNSSSSNSASYTTSEPTPSTISPSATEELLYGLLKDVDQDSNRGLISTTSLMGIENGDGNHDVTAESIISTTNFSENAEKIAAATLNAFEHVTSMDSMMMSDDGEEGFGDNLLSY